MAKTQKPAANTSKRPSADARPKLAKENVQPRSSTAARPALAPKPPQTHADSSNSAKDAETAALVAGLRAEIDKLKKLQAAKPIEKTKLKEIPRPTRIKCLQTAMGLSENKKLYTHCRSVVRDVLAHAGLPIDVDWRTQDAVAIGKVAQLAASRTMQLQRYKGNWATVEIMKTLLKNRRVYRNRIGFADQQVDHNLKKDIDPEELEEEEEKGRGKEEGNDSDDLSDMYMGDVNGGESGNEDGRNEDDGGENGSEDEGGNRGKDIDDGGKDGYGDDEVFGGNDDEGRNGENGSEDEGGNRGKDIDDGGKDDYGDDEVFGGNDDEGRNGEGSDHRAKQAGRKRKITQDEEPVTATRAKKIKLNPTRATRKAAPKGKNSKK